MNALLRFELGVALAALRRIAAHPSRRTFWAVAGAFAVAAIAFDVATSDVAARDLGAWKPSLPAVVVVVAGIFAFAAFVGARTPLTYGTRAADTVWWRYAGVETGVGQRATTAILTARATLCVAAGAVPMGALLALAAPQRAGTIVGLAAAVLVMTPATLLVSSAFASRASGSVAAPPAVRAVRGTVPSGVMAARWLLAARRGELLVPYDRLAFGIVAGLLAPRAAAAAGGQVVALAIVVGGLAVILDAAIRRTTAPATLRSPWWRGAVGTSPRGVAVWAFCDAAGGAALLVGIVFGLGIALGRPLVALAALPAALLAPAALRLVVLAVDTFFPGDADRRSVAATARVAVVLAFTAGVFTLALMAGARGGPFGSIAATTAALLASVAVAAWCSAARLPHAVA